MNTNTKQIEPALVSKFKDLIDKSTNILVISHTYPDPDAICSMLLTRAFIKQYRPTKNIELVCESTPSDYIKSLDLAYTEYIQSTRDFKFDIMDYDLIIMVDNPEFKRSVIAEYVFDIDNTRQSMVIIDHHESEVADKSILCINQARNCASEQIYLLFKQLLGDKFAVTREIAYITQVGIISDTNRFLFDKISGEDHASSDTYKVMAECREVNAFNNEILYKKLNPINQGAAGPLAILLKNMKTYGDCAYSYISKYSSLKYSSSDVLSAQKFFTDHYIRALEGINWGFLVKKAGKKKGTYRVILRAVEGTTNVRLIAEKISSGGGHDNAAVCEIKAVSMEEAVEKIEIAIKTF